MITQQFNPLDQFAQYSKFGGTTNHVAINKGQLNKVGLKPKIINENVEPQTEIQATVVSGLIVGQIFKASHDNISELVVTVESQTIGASGVDYIEGYANSPALQAVWVEVTNVALLEEIIVSPNNSSSQSMKLNLASNNNEWANTVSALNLTEFVFEMDYYQTIDTINAELEFFIGDGVDTKSILLSINTPNEWATFNFNEIDMSDDGGTSPDITAITKFGFRVTKKKGGEFGYVDNIELSQSAGHITARLWDMGSSIPVSGVTTLASGTLYSTLSGGASGITENLPPGKTVFQIPNFNAGTTPNKIYNNPLTVDNYYAITLHYEDVNINIYGPDDDDITIKGGAYYNNGFAFTASGVSQPMNAIGEDRDLMFSIFSIQDVYITDIRMGADANGGKNSRVRIINEGPDNSVLDTLTTSTFPHLASYEKDLSLHPIFLPKGGTLEIYYHDDSDDDVTHLDVDIGYIYIPPTVNG